MPRQLDTEDEAARRLAVAAVAVGARAIDVGSTENKPELVRRSRSAQQPGKRRRVVLSLGADTDTDSPLPELAADDRLLALAELELTTDADDPNHPGLIGNAYSYAPEGRGDDAARRRPRAGGGAGARQGDRDRPQAVARGDHATSATMR